jgi:hypothetical protein
MREKLDALQWRNKVVSLQPTNRKGRGPGPAPSR